MHIKESFNNFLVYFGTIPIESALFFGFSDSSPEIIHENYTWNFIESYPSDITSNLYRDAPQKICLRKKLIPETHIFIKISFLTEVSWLKLTNYRAQIFQKNTTLIVLTSTKISGLKLIHIESYKVPKLQKNESFFIYWAAHKFLMAQRCSTKFL